MKVKVFKLVERSLLSLVICYILGFPLYSSVIAMSGPIDTGLPALLTCVLFTLLALVWKAPYKGKRKLLWAPLVILGPWYLVIRYEQLDYSTEPLAKAIQLLIGAAIIAIVIGVSKPAWKDIKEAYQKYLSGKKTEE